MILLGHVNHDKWPNVTPVQNFCRSFEHANTLKFFRGSKYLQNKTIKESVMSIFSNMNT